MEPLRLGGNDVRGLVASSAAGRPDPALRPELLAALERRGWDAAASARSPGPPATPASLAEVTDGLAEAFPLLVRVVAGHLVVWSHRTHGWAGLAVDDVAAGLADVLPPEPDGPAPAPDPLAAVRPDPDYRPSGRTPVWFVTCAQPGDGSPLALGMIQSAIRCHDGGRLLERYDLRPIRVTAEEVLAEVMASDRPGVLMLSNYIWTLPHNLALAARVRRLLPGTLTVFGGPSAPKYEQDASDFFAAHPQVDVVVRGEGEGTAPELLDALDGDPGRAEALRDVAGLTVRVGDRIVRTEDRPRLSDLDAIPSPYLTGLFDHLTGMNGIWALETNRGCPYGCTFCDWGSATLARVRKYDLDRVLAEIDWIATHGVPAVFVADANFGLYARDVEIAERLAHGRRVHGAPGSVLATFAKNTTKHTLPIVEIFTGAGLASEATLSFQTTDERTLLNIRRHNVKRQVYDEMTVDARERGLPVLSDMMLALPGSTMETLKADLEVCMDGDVTTRMFGTIVLPNSPMNDPEYRTQHGIVTDSEQQLVACDSFTREDREEMVRFRDVHRIADHFGVLRQVLRFAAAETGRRAVDVLWELYEGSLADPGRFPLTSWFMLGARRYLTVPAGWSPFLSEVRTLLVERLGVADDAALDTALAVQQALLPAPGRRFPDVAELDHDFVAYRAQHRDADGWRPLRCFGPGTLEVADPNDVCGRELKETHDVFFTVEGNRKLFAEGGFMGDDNWELDSPLARHLRGAYFPH
jgi:radical SAM superfamily enzyme YgiQ (UPF0313 family)